MVWKAGIKNIRGVSKPDGLELRRLRRTQEMNTESVRRFFAWCTVVNAAILLLWFVLFLAAKGMMIDISGRYFGVSEDKAIWLNFAGIGFYKLAILFFNLAPYIALRIMAARK
jgi:hypothetical protein